MHPSRPRVRALTGPVLLALAVGCQPDGLPTRVDGERLVSRLGDAFNHGDVDEYLSLFAAGYRAVNSATTNRLQATLTPGGALHSVAHANAFQRLGPLGALAVEQQFSAPGVDPVDERRLFVFEGSGRATRVRFEIPLRTDTLPQPGGEFHCTACNYRFAVGRDWIAQPLCRQRSGCLEGVLCYSLAAPLQVTLSVQVAPTDEPAEMVLATLVRDERGEPVVDPQAWTPPHYGRPGAPMPRSLTGARCRAGTHRIAGESWLFLATFGPVRYFAEAHGETAVLERERQRIDDLLAGFRLLDPDLDPMTVVQRSAEAHMPGTVDGQTFHDPGLRVWFEGPTGWRLERCASSYTPHLIFRCPEERATAQLKGMPPPFGARAWTQVAADRAVATALAVAHVTIVGDTGWAVGADADGFASRRTIEGRRAGTTGAADWIGHVGLDEDLLVLVEIETPARRGLDEARPCLDRLRRR